MVTFSIAQILYALSVVIAHTRTWAVETCVINKIKLLSKQCVTALTCFKAVVYWKLRKHDVA